MTHDPERPKVPDVMPAVRAFMNATISGCCLHIVLDDGNLRDGDIDFCIKYAQEQAHPECEALAKKLRLMSMTQRQVLYRRQ